MTDHEIRDDDGLLVEAADWLVCLTSGNATEEDAAGLADWRAASPAHEAAFRQVAGVRSYAAIAATTTRPAAMGRRAVLAGGATAALAAVTIGMARPPLGLWPSFAELTADHRTAVGERFAFAPVAGVKVEMNSRTALSLLEGGQGISLVTGEAFVTASQLGQPFRVETERLCATTDGGQFNVQTLGKSARVACISGVIDCEGGTRSVRLRANEQLLISPDGSAQHRPIDGRKATAWRRGLLIFEGAPLTEVVDQINLYRSGRIVLTNSSIGKLPVNAVFHTGQIEDAVPQIAQLLNLQARHLAGGVVLIS